MPISSPGGETMSSLHHGSRQGTLPSEGRLCHAAVRTPNPVSRKRIDAGVLVVLFIDFNQHPLTECLAQARHCPGIKADQIPFPREVYILLGSGGGGAGDRDSKQNE